MAKYDITYPDGEKETIELYGPVKDRERRIEYLELYGTSPKQMARERSEKSEVAKVSATTEGLPELIGSEKQVAWALTIRKEKLGQLKEAVEKMKQLKPTPEVLDKMNLTYEEWAKYANIGIAIADKLEDRVKNQTASGWWIDNRTLSFNFSTLIMENKFQDLTTEYKAMQKEYAELFNKRKNEPPVNKPVEQKPAPKKEEAAPAPPPPPSQPAPHKPIQLPPDATQTVRGLKLDANYTAKTVLSAPNEAYLKHPERYDVKGLDTKGTRPWLRKKPLSITPKRPKIGR